MEPMTEAENTKPELPENVRVRFCPSPNRHPARRHGPYRTVQLGRSPPYQGHVRVPYRGYGRQRDSEESYNQIIEALNWLGIDWDEGINVGGPDGPYRQSERTQIYKDVAAKLFEAGYAYESFSTPEEIEARNVAAGVRRPLATMATIAISPKSRRRPSAQKAVSRLCASVCPMMMSPSTI